MIFRAAPGASIRPSTTVAAAVAAGLIAGVIFTVAAAPAWADRKVPPCDAWVHVIDPDPNGVNLRAGPGARNKIVDIIPKDDKGTTVRLTGTLGGWMRVEVAEDAEGRVVFMGTAWGHGSRFGVNTRGPGRLLAAASGRARVIGRTPAGLAATVAGCKGKWLYVKSKRGAGWLAPGNYCGSAVTACP